MRPCAGIPILIFLAAAVLACQSGPRPVPPLPGAGEPPALSADAAPRPGTIADNAAAPAPAQLDEAMAGGRAEAEGAAARAAAAKPFAPMAP